MRVAAAAGVLLSLAVLCAGAAAQERDVPRVRVREPHVGPAYSPEIIGRVVRSHMGAIRRCYEGAAARDPAARTASALAFTIGGDGRVVSVEVDDAAAGGSAAGECLRREISTWVFPAPPGGGTIVVRYPLNADATSPK